MANLSALQLDQGNYAGAQRYGQQALELHRKLGGDENSDVASSQPDVRLARAFPGDTAAAGTDVLAALEIRRHLLHADHPRILASQVRLSEVLVSERTPE